MYKKLLLIPVVILTLAVFTSCEDEPEKPKTEQPTKPDNPSGDNNSSLSETKVVTVDLENGKNSINAPFRRIDSVTFMLNYVTYKIVNGHINVIGGDNPEIQYSLKGRVDILPEFIIDGQNYKVRVIDNGAFNDFSGIKTVNIPNSVITFSERSFRNCINLQSIDIPNSVTSIGSQAFEGCKNLKRVKLPNSITEIPNESFRDCTSLSSIEIPSTVTEIGIYAFDGCKNLKSIKLPESITKISDNLLSNCTSLSSIEIPNSVTDIEKFAFYNCTSLSKLTLPSTIKYIEFSAFIKGVLGSNEGTIDCHTIYCFAIEPPSIRNYYYYDGLRDFISKCTVYVPKGSKDVYENTKSSWRFAEIIEMEE